MDQKAIEKVIRLFEASSVASMELETADFKIKLSKTSNLVESPTPINVATPSVATSTPAQPELMYSDWLCAPIVGTYYEAANPDAKPFVSVGQRVKEGQVVCVIEAMKVMNEIKAHRAGVVLEIKAINAKLVEFNQPLMRIGD
jgi:acetyl-CoA carboxylase biotin carboxyl carrier protein